MTSTYSINQHTRHARQSFLAFVVFSVLALLTFVGETRAQTASADLTVTKSGDETARVGGTITYNLTVSNGGPDSATNVVLSDPIPANTTFVSASVTAGEGTVSFDGTTLDVTFSSIGAFESGGVLLIVSVNADTPRGTIITNAVTARSSASDPQLGDNTATWPTFITGPFAGDVLISEFRLRGPAGATDEYIEIYNNSPTPHAVQAIDRSSGYGIAASDGIVRCVIPNGTVLPARGHFLCVNDVGYSLSLYPGADSSTAVGDATYSTDIPDNAGLAIFRTSDTKNFNLANRFDAVGSTNVTDPLYKEGTGYPALSPLGLDYAFVRDSCGKSGSTTVLGNCPTGGLPNDTDNNAVDFFFVSTDGNSAGAGQRLGAPGPENLASPIQRNTSFTVDLLDPCAGSASPPNRVRAFTSDALNNSTFGTLDIRRTVINGTGEEVTRLRWRIIDITTHPTPAGIADLRARSSSPIVVTVDHAPCGSETSDVTVQGTTLEEPPTQTIGGGFNSTLSSGTVTLQTPLALGASLDVRFLLGIQKTGTFKFYINIEALSREPEIPPDQDPGSVVTRMRASARKRKGLTSNTTISTSALPSTISTISGLLFSTSPLTALPAKKSATLDTPPNVNRVVLMLPAETRNVSKTKAKKSKRLRARRAKAHATLRR